VNLLAQLPPHMTCLACFTPQSFERRTSKRNGVYYVCPLCYLRIFVNNDTHVFGLLFWAKALADPELVRAARTDLEQALARRGSEPLAVRVPSPSAGEHDAATVALTHKEVSP
jgi:hypothetical protein